MTTTQRHPPTQSAARMRTRNARGAPDHDLITRLGKRTYAALTESARGNPAVRPDDTGWRIDGDAAWLWVTMTEFVTRWLRPDARAAASN